MRRVVITGMGIVSSIGNDVQEVTASLHGAKSGITFSPSFEEHGFRSRVYGRPTLDPTTILDRRALRFHGGGTAWNHVAMDQAILDAGLEEAEISNERTGIVMGSGGPSTARLIEAVDKARESGNSKRVGPFAVPKGMSSTASATLATWFKIKGVNYSISSACATSNHCIGNAYELIQWGKQDRVFAGGCEELDWTLSVLFDAMGAMSSTYNNPTASRAYDKNRDGFVIAGGAGVVGARRIRDGQSARRENLWPKSSAMAQPPMVTTWSPPPAKALCAACAWRMQGLKAPIDYINPHGTSTPVGDAKEIDAVREVFGAKATALPISSTKSLTGHSLGATGVQEAIYSLIMMQNNFICESAHIEEIDPAMADMNIVRKRIDNAKLGHVMSNSFGFGGTNATIILKNPEA